MIELKNITKAYQMGDQTILALDDVSLTINDGEYVAIIGPSGSGKSTLMNVLGCLDNPSSGQYLLNGKDVSRLRDDQLADARNKNIGFVFQRFNLMGRMSALRNVEMPARYGGKGASARHKSAVEALSAVGLADRVNHTPVELSGGQQQRVAIARAMVNQPRILLADEPTGALDSKTGRDILDLFERLHAERGMTVIVVTHDPSVAARANRVISIRDGRIESDLATAKAAAGVASVGVVGHDGVAPVVEAVPAAATAAAAAATATAVPTARDAALASLSKPSQTDGASKPPSAPSAPSPAPAKTDTTAPLLSAGDVWKRGLVAVVIAVIVNVALSFGIGALLPFATRLPMFSPVQIALFTAVFGLIGVGVFALINRRAQTPVKAFRTIALIALLLSLVPNVAFAADPALMRQVGLQGNAGFTRGQFGGANGANGATNGNRTNGANGATNGNRTNGANGANGAQAGSQNGATGQTTRQQGNFRGAPGLGPLGSLFGGNTSTGANGARTAGGAFTTIPLVALSLLHIVAYGIIVSLLTRGQSRTAHKAKVDSSGLT